MNANRYVKFVSFHGGSFANRCLTPAHSRRWPTCSAPDVIRPRHMKPRLLRRRIGWEERLDAQLLQRDVVWCAEARERGEGAEMEIAFAEVDGQERRGGDLEV